MDKDKKICIGEISNVHGIRGQLTIRVFAEDPELLLMKDAVTDESGRTVFNFTGFAPHRDIYLATLEDVKDRSAAERLKGTRLYIDRARLPELGDNEIYHVDLVGMTVIADGGKLGEVISVQNYGAGDLLEIKRAAGKNVLLPYTAQTIIDIQDNKITAELPGGLLELYE